MAVNILLVVIGAVIAIFACPFTDLNRRLNNAVWRTRLPPESNSSFVVGTRVVGVGLVVLGVGGWIQN